MSTTSSFQEGDRVQYKVDLEGVNLSEGTIQKVIRGGESLSEVSPAISNIRPTIPRYIIEDDSKHTYETFTEEHLVKKI